MKLSQNCFNIKVCARGSKLSLVQVEEVEKKIKKYFPSLTFSLISLKTTGDLDQKTSLRDLGATDFFTREIDRYLLEKKARIAIHSAKDLPDPIPRGLAIAAFTKGVDPKDSLVLRDGVSIGDLNENSVIATSSYRREEAVLKLKQDVRFTDIRGTIEQRLEKLYQKKCDGVVIAKAALLRLKLQVNAVELPGDTVPLQGRLAIVCRDDDELMKKTFAKIHYG